MRIKITTQSYTLTAGRGGDIKADTNVLMDEFGFPYLNGRRLKGLLRESALEVLSRLKITNHANYIEAIFGKTTNSFLSSNDSGLLHFQNAYLENYKNILTQLNSYNKNDKTKVKINKQHILSSYTSIISQTTIEQKKGIIKDTSLRTFRAINPAVHFLLDIDTTFLSNAQLALLKLSFLDLKKMGISRNRGLGFIKVEIDGVQISNNEIIKCIETIKQNNNEAVESNYIPIVIKKVDSKDESVTKAFTFLCTANIILQSENSNPNAISSDNVINGNVLRGALATKLIRQNKIKSIAHKDEIFRNLILSNDVKFSFAFPTYDNELFYPLSMQWQYEKDKNELNCFDIFNETNQNKNLKFKASYTNSSNNKLEILKEENFHNTRSDEKERIAGKNINGKIFYYQSIKAGTQFTFFITAPISKLEAIDQLIPINNTIRVGRSKYTQYGELQRVIYDGININPQKTVSANEFVITCLTPLILFNKNGISEVNVNLIKSYIEDKLLTDNAKLLKLNAAIQPTKVTIQNTQWNAGSKTYHAFAIGSTFKIKLDNSISFSEFESLGENTNIGFGALRITEYNNKNIKLGKIDNINHKVDNVNDIEVLINTSKKQHESNLIKKQVLIDLSNSKIKELSNNTCNTIIQLLKDNNDFNTIKSFIEGRKDKIFGANLDKAKLYSKLLEINIEYSSKNDNILSAIETYKIYWTAYFKQTVKMNKVKK